MNRLNSMRVKAVLFDMDGTLAETDEEYLRRLVHLARPWHFLFGRTPPARQLRRWMMASEGLASFLLTVPDRLGIDEPLAWFTDRLASWRGLGRPGTFRAVQGVPEMLASLAVRYPLAVVSSRDRRGTLAFLDQSNLCSYFAEVVTALSARRMKPHPAPVIEAARALGVAPENCLMVGDTRADILAGRRAGAQTVGVLCGFGEREDLEACGTDAILTSTAEVGRLLGG
jgi:HAD superfamily hydrolase (TIGR01549 family)